VQANTRKPYWLLRSALYILDISGIREEEKLQLSYVRFQAFTATECNEVFSRDQPCRLSVEYTELFRDCLQRRLHDTTASLTSAIGNYKRVIKNRMIIGPLLNSQR
jgi:hypothetical protein